MSIPLDYETLRLLWWVLLGVLLIGFAVMDGFDLGVAIWLPFLPRTQIERRILINSIGPTWEGNQVWFILGGGAIFAAWPMLYALSFSGFYAAMLLTLLALILRPVGFKYRSKVNHPTWRAFWDLALFIGGFVPALIFGVAIGNVLQGVPFYFDETLRPFYTGTFLALLNPLGLWCGILSIFMFSMHGAFFLVSKTEGHLQRRAIRAARSTAFLVIVFFAVAGAWLYFKTGYTVSTTLPHDGPSNPLYKTVTSTPHAWFSNYETWPWLMVAPILGLLMPLFASLFTARAAALAFTCSAISLIGMISTIGLAMFPFILPSSSNPSQSLMIWDSSSSQLTLFIMLVATLIFFPIVLAYTAWAYRVLRGKVTEETIRHSEEAY